MTVPNAPVYEFGQFRYDSSQHLLFRDGQIVPLVPKAIDTLQVLVERHGRVVEKAELMKLVWPDTVVEDVGLARNISLLRKALEEGDTERYVETIPRRGYRFTAAVTVLRPEAPKQPAAAPIRVRWRWPVIALVVTLAGGLVYWEFYVPSKYLVRPPGSPGLAVVPFECPEPQLGTFCSGLSDLVVANLVKAGGLSVVSPSTVRRHQAFHVSMGLMGRLLGLEVLVEGTAQQLEGQLRASARLVDVHTGKVIWADTYDRPAGDMGGAQAEVAHEISSQIVAHLAIRGSF